VSQAEIVAALVALAVQAGLAFAGAGVWALVTGMLMTNLLLTIMTFSFVDWRPGLRWGSTRFKEMLRYSFAALGSRLFAGVYAQVDAVILGKLFGEVVLGFYSMAKQIALLPVYKVSAVVNQLATPVMAGLQHDAGQMRGALLRQMRLVTCLTMPLCVGLALVADDFIRVVLTDKWLPAVPALQILCLFSAWQSFSVMLPPVLFARYREGFMFWWNASLLLVMPLAFWAGAAWNGAVGMALAWITIYPMVTLFQIREVMKELNLSWTTIGIQLRPIMIATVIMISTISLIRYAFPLGDSVSNEIFRLAATSVIGAFIYVLIIYWQGKLLVLEMGELLGWLLRRSRPTPTVN
jgi:O-antigen/teichoic acid export membrane protein